MRIVTLAAAISGNKGAATMIEAIHRHFGETGTLTVLTTYPEDDSRRAEPGIGVVGLTPRHLLGVALPVSMVARILPGRVRYRVIGVSPALRAIAEADVVADISGVSFADDRGFKFHVYNAMLTVLPMLVGTPIVKCSQAMGPFEHRTNRLFARALLPRVERILYRGDQSRRYLEQLSIPLTMAPAADLAFSLRSNEPLPAEVERLLQPTDAGVVVVMPSAVVEAWCERHEIDHTAVFAGLVERIADQCEVAVVLVPHAYRESGKPRRMDDARVCRSIVARVGDRPDVRIVDADLTPAQLRAVVDRSDMLVASRFHGMVTGLGSATPTVVVGWGHKYSEVLSQFGVSEAALDYSTLRDADVVWAAVATTWSDREQIQTTIRNALPGVRESANQNFVALADVARSS